MTYSTDHITQTVIAFLIRSKKMPDDFDADTPLYADGAGLDSLETAELSAVLEDSYGSDPYSTGTIPTTLGGILEYYRDITTEV